MFYNAKSFNQPLNNWDTSNVTNICCMFYDTRRFNQPLCNQKRERWAFVETHYFGEVDKRLPTELIRHISGFAFCSWGIKNVSNNTNMFSGAISYTHRKITEIL